MVNYGKAMIYKLCCKDPNIIDIYIGSTTNFSRRKNHHKCNCNNVIGKDYNNYKYQFIRDNGGFENFDMILIENVSCNSKRELEQIERKYMDELKPSLNTTRPYITEKERKTINNTCNKTYCKNNKEKIAEYTKKYRVENKTKIQKKDKKYYEKNKTKILEKLKTNVNCEFCNCSIRKYHLKKHQQTINCKKFQFIED